MSFPPTWWGHSICGLPFTILISLEVFVMGVWHRIKKLLSRRMIKPTIYTIIMIVAMVCQNSFGVFSVINLVTNLSLTVFFVFITYMSSIYPDKSVKRESYCFLTSIFILVNGIIWSMENLIEFSFGGFVSVIVDLIPMIIIILIILVLNVIKKGYDLVIAKIKS
ncbi:MAG: hypothetical protein ACFFG0_07695 [Candidatus Thorarchaeota archaeon]